MRISVTRQPNRAATVLTTVVLVGGLVACGGGDDSSESRPSAPETPAISYDGTSPEDLLACLTDAGLPAVAKESTPLGVEVPVSGIEVEPLGEDPKQGVTLWVFIDPAAAQDNRVAITLSVEDTPTSSISGNVVVGYYYLPDSADPAISAVDGCLPV